MSSNSSQDPNPAQRKLGNEGGCKDFPGASIIALNLHLVNFRELLTAGAMEENGKTKSHFQKYIGI